MGKTETAMMPPNVAEAAKGQTVGSWEERIEERDETETQPDIPAGNVHTHANQNGLVTMTVSSTVGHFGVPGLPMAFESFGTVTVAGDPDQIRRIADDLYAAADAAEKARLT